MKEEYEEIIKKQIAACNDIALLHLIATLLEKEGYPKEGCTKDQSRNSK